MINSTPASFLAILLVGSVFICGTARSQDQFPPTVREEYATSWPISGSVESPWGVPVPNATVRLVRPGYFKLVGRRSTGNEDKSECDWKGKFQIENKVALTLVASAPGFAPTAIPSVTGSQVEISLETGRTITGRVRLPDGKPAAGVKVQPVLFWHEKLVSEMKHFSSPIELERNPGGRFWQIAFPNFGKDWQTKTGQSGRFEISNVPENKLVAVLISASGCREKIVWVRPDEGEFSVAPPNQQVVDNDFETELDKGLVLELIGRNQNSGLPEKISRVFVEPTDPRRSIQSGYPFCIELDINPGSKTLATLNDHSNGCFLWVVPENNELLGVRVELTDTSQPLRLEEIVTFKQGVEIAGTVTDAATNKPVAGAGIGWWEREGFIYTKDGDFPRFDLATDKRGSYSISVPDQGGILAVVGGLEGYQTVVAGNVSYPSLKQRFHRELTADRLKDTERLDFVLSPSYQVNVRLVRPDGRPEANAVVYATERAAINGSRSTVWGAKSSTATTNEQGVAILENWFSDAKLLPMARKQPPFATKPGSAVLPSGIYTGLRSQSVVPRRVDAFTESGLLQGVGSIPIPLTDQFGPIEMEIKLRPTATIEGRVLDENEKPVANIIVSAQAQTSQFAVGAQVWKTRTRDDGRYRLTGLTQQVPVIFNIGDRYEAKRLERSKARATIDWNLLTSGATLTHPDLYCQDFRTLGEPLPDIDLTSLGHEESIEAVLEYTAEQLKRIDDSDPGVEFARSSSSVDPVAVFGERLFNKVIPALNRAIGKSPGSEAELRCIQQLLAAVDRSRDFQISAGTSQVRLWAIEKLLQDFKGRPEAGKLLLSSIGQIGSPREKLGVLERVFAESGLDSTRLQAGWLLIDWQFAVLSRQCRWSYNSRVFEREYLKLDGLLSRFDRLAGQPPVSLVKETSKKIQQLQREMDQEVTRADQIARSSNEFQGRQRAAKKLLRLMTAFMKRHQFEE